MGKKELPCMSQGANYMVIRSYSVYIKVLFHLVKAATLYK